jgi:hypothetical protein
MVPAEKWLIIAFVCMGLVSYGASKLFKKGKLKGDPFFWVIFCPALTFFLVLGLAGKYTHVSDKIIQFINELLGWGISTLGLGPTQTLVGIVVTAAGFGAHLFKRKNQVFYGNVEIWVGFLSAVFVAGTLTPGNLEPSKWATLAGAAYVVARGFGNRKDGKDKLGAAGIA